MKANQKHCKDSDFLFVAIQLKGVVNEHIYIYIQAVRLISLQWEVHFCYIGCKMRFFCGVLFLVCASQFVYGVEINNQKNTTVSVLILNIGIYH